MNRNSFPAIGLLFICAVSAQLANAANLVEMKQAQEGLQKIWIEGKKIRVDTPGDIYMIMDFGTNRMYTVNTREKTVMDMSSYLQKNRASGATAYQVEIQKKDATPRIAGYATREYTTRVNGQHCATSYVSLRASQDAGLGPIIEAMSYMNFNPMVEQFMDPCEKASVQIAKQYQKLGVPLRQMGKNGEFIYEVTRIEKNAALPKGGFSLPKGYPVTDIYKQMSNSVPGMTPEMRKSMEQMMRQYGQ